VPILFGKVPDFLSPSPSLFPCRPGARTFSGGRAARLVGSLQKRQRARQSEGRETAPSARSRDRGHVGEEGRGLSSSSAVSLVRAPLRRSSPLTLTRWGKPVVPGGSVQEC